jgi:hypothetical protein
LTTRSEITDARLSSLKPLNPEKWEILEVGQYGTARQLCSVQALFIIAPRR